MHFKDLSPYSYDLPHPLAKVRNVGWLSKGMEYPTGRVGGFVEALKRWAVGAAANRMRGYELCRFCPLTGYEQMSTNWNGEALWLGSFEIWIPDGTGGIFAAPSLIVHYVEAHDYLPPQPFIDSVLRPIPDDWDAEAVAAKLIEAAFAAPTPDSQSSTPRG
jgi:hypothetical protein